MNELILHGLHESRAILEALPIGLVIYDEDRRMVLTNSAYCEALGVPADALRPASSLEDNLRLQAYRGIFGPGDPEHQVSMLLAQDRSVERRVRRRHPDGRTFESQHVPLGNGAVMECITNTTSLIAMRDEAEMAVARIHMAMASLRIGLAVFGPDRRLGLHNRRFTELLGLASPSLAPGTPFSDVLQIMQVRDEYAGFEGDLFLASQMSFDRSRPANFRRQRANGQVIDIQSDPLPDGGWTMTVSDISALARAEDEARRRAGMLDGIVRHIPHGIAVYGPDRKVSMLNAAYGQIMHGAPVMVGDTMAGVVRRRAESGEYGPGDPDEVFRQQRLNDPAIPQVRRRKRPSGQTIDVRMAPLPDGGHLSVVTDVTSLVTAESELARRAETMAAMLSSIRHGIILWDSDQCIVAANPAATELLGAEPGFIRPGRTLEELIQGALARGNLGDDSVGRSIADSLRTRDRSKSHQDQRCTRSGRVLEVRSDPTPDGGFVTTYTDVTTVRQAEEALQISKAAAEAANTAKSRFLAAMSHELRTPLMVVITQADAIGRAAADELGRAAARQSSPMGGLAPEPIEKAAGGINGAGRQLLSIIDSILDVARLEAGRFELSEEFVDVGRLIHTCVHLSDSSAAAAEVTLTADLPSGLPGLRGDERRLRQTLHHLVTNAVKFTEATGSVSIGVGMDPGGNLTLHVTDTGIGIAEGDLERVFEPFTQLDTGEERVTGAGLGLYVSRALMRAHGGDLHLRSQPGAGTTAIMTLPAARVVPP